MNIDDSAAENIVLQQDGDGGGGGGGGRNTGVPSTRSGGKRRDPDPAFTPGPEFEIEDEDEDQGYTQVTRRTTRATRSTSSPLNLKATKEAAQRAVVRIMESERKNVVEVAQGDQLALLRNLVESLLRQMQESNEAQKVMSAKIDSLQATNDTQNRTIEALRALSEENVRKPTYSQVAQTGTTPLNEAEKVTIPSSPKASSTPQSMRHDERAVSIDTGRAKVSTTDFSEIKEKLQQGIDNLGTTKGLKIQFLRPGPGMRIEVIFENKAQAEKARKHTQWATSQYQGTRVKGEKWYPVKCDMVAKQAVLGRRQDT